MTSVPVTDAFDESDAMESMEVELTLSQIEWLKQTAEERGVSVGHVLRTVVTAQMRMEANGPAAARSGDGAPPAFADERSGATSSEKAEDDRLIARLRAAKEKLDELSESEEASDETNQEDDGNPADEASSLFPHIEDVPSTAETSAEGRDAPDPSTDEKDERSMFDLVEE